MEYLNILIRAIFIDNMIFAYFLGMCSYLAVSKKVSTAAGLGCAVIFVLFVTTPLNYLIDKYILQEGALYKWIPIKSLMFVDLSFLTFIIFISIIATMVQLVEMIIEKFSPKLYNSLGIFLPLIAVNCSILGGNLFMQQKEFINVGLAATYGLGSGIGWFLAIIAIAAIREKLAYSNVLPPLRGIGITFILTGLMSIGFMSFQGIKIIQPKAKKTLVYINNKNLNYFILNK